MSKLSSEDIIKTVYPSISSMIIDILEKFKKELDECVKRKNNKIISSDKLTNLLSVFPRNYSNYSVCVTKFVSFGAKSPDAAITFLLQLLPRDVGNVLFEDLRSKLPFYSEYKEIIDLFLYLYFFDCCSQLLSIKRRHDKIPELMDICYDMVSAGYEPYQEPMRLEIVKQCSVVFGFISAFELPTMFQHFESGLTKYDPILFLYLHRFIRLSTSDLIDFDALAMFFVWMINFAKKNAKKIRLVNVWAEVLCSLCQQLNCDGVDAITKQMEIIHNFAMERTHAKDADDAYIILVGIILQRFSKIKQKHFQNYLQKSILDKVEKPHRTLGCLKAFLVVLRGSFVSKSSSFWEWGKLNASAHNGIEATHLAEPTQDQKDPNSFTNLFFKYFIPVKGIEQYSDIIGEILLNLAARDFEYFTKETTPRLISSFKTDGQKFIPLFECLCRIVNPDNHFEEWAQTNPRNIKVNISLMIPNLFVMLKEQLFSVVNGELKVKHADTVFSIPLSQSIEYPVLVLPIHYNGISDAMSKRIEDSTKQCSDVLSSLSIRESESQDSLVFNNGDIEITTADEDRYIKLLSLSQRIVNSSDLLSNPIGNTIISCVTSDSKAVAVFAMEVINLLFSKSAENRMELYNIILSALDNACKSTSVNDICILLLLINKLFDLSMRPKTKKESIDNFISNGQATAISLLCINTTEVRDMTMNFIERLNRFARSFGFRVPLYQLINDASITEKALAKLTSATPNVGNLTPRIVASSRYNDLFDKMIPEIILELSNNKDINPNVFHQIFLKVDSSLETIGRNPMEIKDENNTSLFYNLVSVLFNCIPAIDENGVEQIKKYFGIELNASSAELIKDMKKVNEYARSLISFISTKKKEIPKNEMIERCFNNVSWYSSLSFVDNYSRIDLTNISDPEFFLSFTTIAKNFFKANDIKYSIIASKKISETFEKIVTAFNEYFIKNEINKSFFLDNASIIKGNFTPTNTTISKNFCEIVEAFTKSLIFEPKVTDGPILLPSLPEYAKEDTYAKLLQLCATFSLNLCKVGIQDLNEVAQKAVSGCVSISSVFYGSFQLTPEISQCFLSNNLDELTLRRSLYFHFDSLIKDYMRCCYVKGKEESASYLKAIHSFFYGEQPKNETRAQMSVRMLAPIPDNDELKCLQLSPAERELQEAIITNAGNILVCAINFLMNENYEIRFIAFRIVQKVAPLALSVLSPNPDEECSELMKTLNSFSPHVYTGYSVISPKHVVHIVKLLSRYLFRLSEGFIEECFRVVKFTSNLNTRTIDQSLILDVLNIFIKNISLEEGGYIKEPTCKLTVFTPLTLVDNLLSIYENVNYSAISVYLQTWNKSETDLETVVTYLLSVKDEDKISSSRAVLVYLARINSDVVCKQLCGKLSFSYWFFVNSQGKFDKEKPPTLEHMTEIDIAIDALCEIAQVSVEPLLSYLPIIVNFSLLFYDVYPQANALLYVVFSGLDDADSLMKLFVGKSKTNKLSVAVNKIHKFFASKSKKIGHKWGNECVKWATGCNDLKTAARAAAIFSHILYPLDGTVLQMIIRSFYTVALCEQTPESVDYLTNVLIIVNRSIDKMGHNKAFKGIFNYLYKVALPFVCVPYNELSIEALCIVGKYIAGNRCKYSDLLELFEPACSLMTRLEDKKAVYGFLLALMTSKKPAGREGNPKISEISFFIFLPRLVACYGAFHNREPFISITDDEIKQVFEIGKCIAMKCDIPESVCQGLLSCLDNPEDCPLDEFSLKVCLPLALSTASSVAAIYYTALAENGDEIMKCAIFSVVGSILRGCISKQDANPYLGLIPIASNHSTQSQYSSFSVTLMESFMEICDMDDMPNYTKKIVDNIKIVTPEYNVADKLTFVGEEEQPEMPNGSTELEVPILMAPFQEQLWNSSEIKKTRESLQRIVVQPHTKLYETLDSKKNEKPSTKMDFVVPKRVEDFINYKKNIF